MYGESATLILKYLFVTQTLETFSKLSQHPIARTPVPFYPKTNNKNEAMPVQFSTLFLISLFSTALALSGCVGSDNSSAPKKPNQPSSDNNTKPGDKNPGVPNPDPSNPDPSNPDPSNPGGGNDNGNEDGGNNPFPPTEEDYRNSDLTSCDFVQPATSNPAYSLGNTNKESTYNIDDYQPAENDNDLSGTWVMINQKSNDLGQFGITQVWEKSFFIIREEAGSSDAFEIASCNTNNFSPITINTENNTLLHADITPMYGSTLFVKTSNTELSEYKPDGLSDDDTALFNKNKAKAIKISSSTASLASLSTGDNKSTIDERIYENTDVWCVNQARKVTNIQKQSGTCAITDNSQSYLNIAVYGDGVSNRITTVESTEASGGIITGAYKIDSALVIGADSPEDLSVDTSEVPNLVLSFGCDEDNTNNFELKFTCNVKGLNQTNSEGEGELSLDITIPDSP